MANAQYKTVAGDLFQVDHGGAASAAAEGLYVQGTKVVGPQGATIADATTGTEIATINAIIARLEAHGLIATA